MGQAGASAFSVAASAAKSLGGAIAGVGIASAVVGFKALNAEAEAFKNTVAGANIELQTAAYISTYKQALHDINSETGRNFANFLANIKKRAGTFLGAAGYSVINFFDTDKTYDQIGAGLKEANRLGTEAEQIAGRIYSFQRKIADRAVEISELDAKISEYRRIAQDSTESAERRSQALAQATELIKQKYEGPNGLVMLNDGLANLMQQQVSLTGSSAEAIDAANQQRIKANQYVRAENDELRAQADCRRPSMARWRRRRLSAKRWLKLPRLWRRRRRPLLNGAPRPRRRASPRLPRWKLWEAPD